MANGPMRLLTDWTTSAGVDGAGLLALVLDGHTPEAIHLATLGYETFVLHADDAGAAVAETAAHVHHVVADPAALPDPWARRFDLVVALETPPIAEPVAAAGLLLTVAEAPTPVPDGLAEVLRESVEDPARPGVQRERAVFARLGTPS